MFARIALDTSEYDSGVKDVTKSGSSLASKLKSGLASAGKAAAVGIGAITTAAGAAVGGLLALEQSTEEYRIAMGRLNTAFESAGYGVDAANQAYSEFYGILGDTDRATEASQLLAKLADNEEDLAEWTNIAAGVNGTFGDSLPIESLIEAANETARTGTVVGTLADALNWAGTVGEDEFNAMLASCSSESERNQLIMETLAVTYDEAANAFYRSNAALIASREAQAQMDAALSELGSAVSDVKTRMTAEFLPAISQVTSGLAGMLSGTEGAEQQFSEGIGALIDSAVARLPEFLDFGVQIITSIAEGLISNLPVIVGAVPQVVTALAEALVEMWPTLVESGSQILSQIGNGIVTYIPELVAMLPDVIVAILDFLTENFPTILEKGMEFLGKFATGIIEAIPDLVAKLPQVITAFVNFIAQNLPVIASSGVNLLLKLAAGIISAIPQLVAQLPAIIKAIVSGLGSMMGSINQVGKNIVTGLWDGINSMVSWIKSKVSGFVGGIVSSVKGVLGIHSPSTVFADMGRNMALGMGEGWDSEFSKIKGQIEGGMNFQTGSVDFASSGLGVSSAGIINSMGQSDAGYADGLTVNLTLPDGTKFATWQLPYLIKAGSAAGTPIAETQKA